MTKIDSEGAMTWVEASLQYACSRNLSRLAMLLVAVRDEISLEMKLAKRVPLAPGETCVR
jgi:hypothetical protein